VACQGVPKTTLPDGAYRGAGGAPRWANSGTVLGSMAAMRTIYKDLAEEMIKPERQKESDQGDSLAQLLLLFSDN
jgi:hypothetical protein